MNNIDIFDILPEVSDEAAYHLSNFMMELALRMDSHYYYQAKNYIDDLKSCSLPGLQENNITDDDITF